MKPLDETFKQNKDKFCMPMGEKSARELETHFEQARQDKIAAKMKNKKH